MHNRMKFKTEGGQESHASGYLARPSTEKAGVVVIQEWWGLVPHIEEVARRFANLGFVALAPDLYRGKSTLEAAEAQHLMQGLDFAKAAKEIAGAVHHLREVEGCSKVGMVGFCMGGALTVLSASICKVDAYAAFYGFPSGADLSQVGAKGLIFFGENEGFFSVPDAQAFAKKQSQAGINTEVVVYQGAGHAFFNDTRKEAYNQAAASDAWRRTLQLFAETLRG